MVNFSKHQNPHRDEKASTLPDRDGHIAKPKEAQTKHGASTVQAPCKEDADSVAIGLNPDSLILNPDPRNLKPEVTASPARAPRKQGGNLEPQDLTAEGVELQHAKDWRKARKSPITPTAWDDLKAEAARAGLSPAEAVRICAAKGWRGFNAGWNWQSAARASPSSPSDTTLEAARLLGINLKTQDAGVIDA